MSQFGFLKQEMNWLESVIRDRVVRFSNEGAADFPALTPPSIPENEQSEYARFLKQNRITDAERLVLALSIVPHLAPGLLDCFVENKNLFIASRILQSSDDISLLPTAQTVLFLLAGNDIEMRGAHLSIFDTDHLFYKKSVIHLGEASPGASPLDGVISLVAHFRDLFIYNKNRPPRFSADFPAHLLSSDLEWEDLILMPTTAETLNDVKITLRHYHKLRYEWKMGNIMRPGCRVLLYGDSGQGKTLTASLLGKLLNRPVYRVDIAATVSKYIGETNQRLEALFNTAENKDWILFFDEGDAMLGQRNKGGENASGHYANQEVAFLLQRIETFDGIVVIATNLRSNIDYAFQRRFDTTAHFKALDAERQLAVWERFWPKEFIAFDAANDLSKLVHQHPLSPASIINVIRRIAAHMAESGEKTVPNTMLQKFIRDEEFKFKGAVSYH